jgi:hypothetical protein
VATPEEHLHQARANRSFAAHLLESQADDVTALQWAVTAAFYSAVHCMESYFITRGLAHQTHTDRAQAMTDIGNRVPGTVYFAYRELRRRSEGGRYYLRHFTRREVREMLEAYLPVVAGFVKLDAN